MTIRTSHYHLRTLAAPSALTARSYEEEPTSANWSVVSQAICATAP